MKKVFLILITLAFAAAPYVSRAAQMTDREIKEAMALLINMNNHLCANVVSIAPLSLKGTYEVRCVEYRGGAGTVDYIVKVSTGEVIKR
jgi:hypothetical protein